jgi:hypothetical protein
MVQEQWLQAQGMRIVSTVDNYLKEDVITMTYPKDTAKNENCFQYQNNAYSVSKKVFQRCEAQYISGAQRALTNAEARATSWWWFQT